MSLTRSPNAREILDFIAENGFGTLYGIHKEKGMPKSSINQGLQILLENNLVTLDSKESLRRKRHAKAYALTFKGLIVFLSNYDLTHPATRYRIPEPSESEEEAIRKLNEKLKREWGIYQSEVDRFKQVLKKNGELLRYPLFQYCDSLERLGLVIYENFINIAQQILKESPSRWHVLSEKTFRTKKRKIAKSLKMLQKFSNGKWVVFQGDVRTPFDPIAFEKQRLDLVKENLRMVFRREDEFLRESFFMYFLMWFKGSRLRLANRDLYDYTKSLLVKEEGKFNFNKEILDKWLAVFSES